MTPKQRFINACLNKEVDRPPVWMMRQAGRYLPEYRAIKAEHATKKMMQTPELACEITLQPVSIVGVDAAILYSDILMIPDAMGMGLDFLPGEGPKFNFSVKDADTLGRLNTQKINDRLSYVFETVKLCVKKLPKDFPLLGFAGAPFTVASYMISGGATEDFADIKYFALTEPKVYHELMSVITRATIDYLFKQADAGVVAVQLFDTWAGVLSPQDYRQLAMPYTQQIFMALGEKYIPSIHYIKGGDYLLPTMSQIKSDVIGVDWRVDLSTVRERTGHHYGIQGNLDPDILMCAPEIIKQRTREMVNSIDKPRQGYIVNLGHGIGQRVPVAHAKCFVDTVKEMFR